VVQVIETVAADGGCDRKRKKGEDICIGRGPAVTVAVLPLVKI
jgi:hypothetical protein